MTAIQNTFRKRLLSGQSLTGGWCVPGSVTIEEAMSFIDYDFLVLDLEESGCRW